jgi:hypothetical protein
MELDKLQQKLIAVARKDIPSDHVPYAFEKRIMAQLATAGVPDGWILWSRALWRAAVPCLMLVAFITVWSTNSTVADNADFSLQFEEAVLAELNDNVENSW